MRCAIFDVSAHALTHLYCRRLVAVVDTNCLLDCSKLLELAEKHSHVLRLVIPHMGAWCCLSPALCTCFLSAFAHLSPVFQELDGLKMRKTSLGQDAQRVRHM